MFRIIGDSSCDLTSLSHISPDILYGRAPLRVIVDDVEFVDTYDLDTRAMMDAVYGFKGKTGSACPSPEEYAELCRDVDEAYIVTISSSLSGSYNSAVLARDLVLAEFPEKKIHVFDSLSAGPELSLIVEKIAQLASTGMAFEQVVAQVADYMTHTALLFQLNSLENLTKNGRVSKMAGMTAKLLGIRMIGIASAEGTVEPLHKSRGTEKTYSLVLQEMRERGFTGGRVILGHAFQEAGAHMMRQMILGEFPTANITVMPLSGLCCYYAEEGGLLVGFEK